MKQLICLIVDDTPMHIEIVEHAIENLNLDIKRAEDGLWAINMCKRQMPDIIILDWMMPNMDGPKFLEELAKIESDKYPYVIMCTAKGESSQQDKSFLAGRSVSLGSMDFLAKPFHQEQLTAKVNQAISAISDNN